MARMGKELRSSFSTIESEYVPEAFKASAKAEETLSRLEDRDRRRREREEAEREQLTKGKRG